MKRKRGNTEINSNTDINSEPVMKKKHDDTEMNSNTDINSYPVEIIQKITGNLKPKEAVQLALASKQTLFNVQRNLTLNKKVHDMSTLVAYGKQQEAHDLLAESPNAQELLLTPASFTDYSGRTFHCTAYEYAYWAKDTHMCRMLEQQMDADTKTTMLKRCETIEKDGLTHEQHGVEVVGSKHFDFTRLITALDNYVQGYDKWFSTGNSTAIKAAWMAVGLAQREVPVHVINEYCRTDRSFYPIPPFDELTLPRVLTYYGYRAGGTKAVFPLGVADSSGLGVDFALLRAGGGGGAALRGEGPASVGRRPRIDLAAVIRLDEVRTADLTMSREILRSAEPEQSRGMTY